MSEVSVANGQTAAVVTVSPPRARMFVALFFLFLIWSLAIWATIASSRARIPAALLVVLLPWILALGVKRLRSHWAMVISPLGFTIPGPTFQPKQVRWSDVDEIGTVSVGSQHFTGVKLKSTGKLIRQYSSPEARILLRRENVSGALVGLSSATNVSTYFSHRRERYGYEVLISANERDRDADEFAKYLEVFRSKYNADHKYA